MTKTIRRYCCRHADLFHCISEEDLCHRTVYKRSSEWLASHQLISPICLRSMWLCAVESLPARHNEHRIYSQHLLPRVFRNQFYHFVHHKSSEWSESFTRLNIHQIYLLFCEFERHLILPLGFQHKLWNWFDFVDEWTNVGYTDE